MADNIFKRKIREILGIEKQPQSLGNWRSLSTFSVGYDGEKNLGEIGVPKEYWLDYDILRIRSWQSYLESEISQTVLNKFATWVVGAGLKLQSEPNKVSLQTEGINLETEDFNEKVEARYTIWANSKYSSYSNMETLNSIQEVAFKNAIIGGDVLVILRYRKNKGVSVQLIDGTHVCSPTYGNDYYAGVSERGNEIRHGIEINSNGEHVAFYVKKKDYTYERVPAKNSAGFTIAFLLYGNRFRLDNHRGLPLISAVLETLAKLDRYKEATVGTAEETSKIAYQVVHQQFSTGENPLAKQLSKAFDADATSDELPVDVQGKQLANQVAATTNKQAYNMPIGSKIETIQGNSKELQFKDFYTTNINIVCAAIGIPPEVALSKYDSNFSASRAALKDWEHTINVKRKKFTEQFLKHVYDLWLHIQILENKVPSIGYLSAYNNDNIMALEAYRNCRFVGASIPHIDPMKEVEAVRLKLGDKGKSIPLITVERATEELSGGESDSNMEQFAKEYEMAKGLNIVTEEPNT